MGEQTALEEYIEQYVIHVRAEKGASEHTVESYARDLRRYARVLEARGALILFIFVGENVICAMRSFEHVLYFS